MYGDKIQIQNIDGQIQVSTEFEDYYNDKSYTILDKQSLGESIGRELLDEDPNLDYLDNCDIIYKEINKQIINELKHDIFDYVQEYIDNNQ